MRWVIVAALVATGCTPDGEGARPAPQASRFPLVVPRPIDVPPAPVPGARIVRRTPAFPPLPASPDRAALVVGIDRYASAPDLGAATADARLVARSLSRLGYGEVRLLLDEAATVPAILDGLRRIGELGPEQTGVVFLAGHVLQVEGGPDGDEEAVDEAFLAADGGLVYDGEVAAALAPSEAPLWIAIAGCFAAGFAEAAGPGRVATYASSEESRSFESPSLGRSFLVHFVVGEALLEEGISSVEGMYEHATDLMRGRYRRYAPLIDDGLPGDLALAGA